MTIWLTYTDAIRSTMLAGPGDGKQRRQDRAAQRDEEGRARGAGPHPARHLLAQVRIRFLSQGSTQRDFQQRLRLAIQMGTVITGKAGVTCTRDTDASGRHVLEP